MARKRPPFSRRKTSEYGGDGVEVSTVYDRPKEVMPAEDKLRLLKSTGDLDPTKPLDPKMFRGGR